MNHKLNIPIVITAEQCYAVIEQASDSIGYWECGFRNHKSEGEHLVSFEVHCVDAKPTEAIPGSESQDEDDPRLYPWALIDQNTIVRGVKLIVSGEMQINPDTRASLLELLADKEEGISMGDADMADCIVQAGVFGELVYG